MAGDTSVNSSPPRHALVHVAQAPAQNRPAQNQPAPAKAAVTPGNSGLDAANESEQWQRAADEYATVYLQADDELPGKLARIEKAGARTEAIVSVAQLHQDAVEAAADNVRNQEERHPVQWTLRPDGAEQTLYNPAEHTELTRARGLKQVLDTALAHAEYTELHVKELGDQLVDAKTSGAAPDATLTKNYNEAVSHNVAGWRVARNNALMARDHANEIQSRDLPDFEGDLTFCQDGLSRAEQLAKIAPGPTLLEIAKETIEIAKAGRQELTAKSKLVMEAKAQLTKVKPEEKTAVGNYVKKLERGRKELVVSNFEAWREALSHANGLVPQNGRLLKIAREGFDEAHALLHDAAPELVPGRR